jgi:hypothetical protein
MKKLKMLVLILMVSSVTLLSSCLMPGPVHGGPGGSKGHDRHGNNGHQGNNGHHDKDDHRNK